MRCKMKGMLYKTYATSNALWCGKVVNHKSPRAKDWGGRGEDTEVNEWHDKGGQHHERIYNQGVGLIGNKGQENKLRGYMAALNGGAMSTPGSDWNAY